MVIVAICICIRVTDYRVTACDKYAVSNDFIPAEIGFNLSNTYRFSKKKRIGLIQRAFYLTKLIDDSPHGRHQLFIKLVVMEKRNQALKNFFSLSVQPSSLGECFAPPFLSDSSNSLSSLR